MAISKYGYVSLEALYEYAMNQKDHSITPNDFMRMNRADVIPIEWILKWACEFIDPNSEGYKMAMELVHDWRKRK